MLTIERTGNDVTRTQFDTELDTAAELHRNLVDMRERHRRQEQVVMALRDTQGKDLEAGGLSHRQISAGMVERNAAVSPSCVLQALQRPALRPSPASPPADC